MTGLDYFKARYYDPRTGQFISEDPANADINPYRYASNNPVNFTDPSGLDDGSLSYSGDGDGDGDGDGGGGGSVDVTVSGPTDSDHTTHPSSNSSSHNSSAKQATFSPPTSPNLTILGNVTASNSTFNPFGNTVSNAFGDSFSFGANFNSDNLLTSQSIFPTNPTFPQPGPTIDSKGSPLPETNQLPSYSQLVSRMFNGIDLSHLGDFRPAPDLPLSNLPQSATPGSSYGYGYHDQFGYHYSFCMSCHDRFDPGAELKMSLARNTLGQSWGYFVTNQLIFLASMGLNPLADLLFEADPVAIDSLQGVPWDAASEAATYENGAYTTFRRDPTTGQVTHYETRIPQTNPQNPNPWQIEKRVDVTGAAHYDKVLKQYVPTPHVHDPSAPGGVRPALPNELPR